MWTADNDPRRAVAVATVRPPAPKKLGSKRITLMTIGSRGDVQPLVALGKVRYFWPE